MARKANTESVQETEQVVEQIAESEIAEVVEDAVSIEPEQVAEETTVEAEPKSEEVVEDTPEEEPKTEQKKIQEEEPKKQEPEVVEVIVTAEPEITAELTSTVFQPSSLIPIYTRPASKYYDCRCKNKMKILDLQNYNGFVPVSVALSGRGVCKYFVRKEHLPEQLQSFIVAK